MNLSICLRGEIEKSRVESRAEIREQVVVLLVEIGLYVRSRVSQMGLALYTVLDCVNFLKLTAAFASAAHTLTHPNEMECKRDQRREQDESRQRTA